MGMASSVDRFQRTSAEETSMHLMPEFHIPGRATIDGPAVLDRDVKDVPGLTIERERFAGSKLRYIGKNTQTSLSRRVRRRERRAVIL
jgi:hypothetical protein